jgi:serine/threonine-protein kinase SRPK3
VGRVCYCLAGQRPPVSFAPRGDESFSDGETRLERPVAIKILVSELGQEHQEASLHRRLSSGVVDHPGRSSVPEVFDCFEVHGPNGVHQCLVMELLGPSMASLAESYAANRLPGAMAWKVARQVVQAIAYVHRMGVVHGGLLSVQMFLSSKMLSLCPIDLHPGNIVLVDESISNKSTEEELRSMDSPVTVEVRGNGIGKHKPQYLVLPSTLPLSPRMLDNCKVKIVDFGSAFLSGVASPRMRCPPPFRAPEAVITGSWDVEADVWSLGCTVREQAVRVSSIRLMYRQIFALIVGYPPFDSFLFKEEELVGQWVATFGELPGDWGDYPMFHTFGIVSSELRSCFRSNLLIFADTPVEAVDLETADLSQWLYETYYDDDKPPYFTENDLKAISKVLQSLLRFRPSERASADDILLESLLGDHLAVLGHHESGI